MHPPAADVNMDGVMAWIALAVVALVELGSPWDELQLEPAQRQRIVRVLSRYRSQLETLQSQANDRSGAARRQLERRIQQLTERRDQEARSTLSDDQRQRYDEIRQWMAEGVPLGDGLYRSYEIVESGPLEDGVERPNRVRFTVVNRANHALGDVALEVRFLDREGALIHSERPRVDRLEPGESRAVVVHYQYVRQWRQRFSKPQVTLLSAQPLP